MGIALPVGLAAGLLALPLLALYILKMRRREVKVGSVFLWENAVRDLRANAPWQRLRPNRLLFLQLAALAALVLALARPYVLRASSVHGDVVVLLDASAAMNATDAPGFPNRLAAAKARVSALIDDLGPDDVMSIVRMARSPRVVIAQSGDRAALHDALASVEGSDEALDASSALSLGAALARGSHGGTLHILTGAGTILPDTPATRHLDQEVTRIGGRVRDLAVVAFAAGFDDAGTLSALARVANYGARQATTDIALSVDGQLLDVRTRTIPAGGQIDIPWPSLPSSARVLEVHLSAADDLAGDKTAWAVVPRQGTRRVLLVTAENIFLQTALTLDPTVQVTTITTATYAARTSRSPAGRSSPQADLTIFDGYRPVSLPSGNVLLVNPPAGRYPGFISGPPASLPASPQIVQDDLGLLRYVQAGDIHIQAAHAITAEAWLRPALSAGAMPLLLAGENGDRRLALLAFDLHDSDLPLQPDLPILVSNLLDWLAPGSTLPADLSLRPGDTVPILPVAGATRVEVTAPDGRRITLAPPFPVAPFSKTGELGVYTLRQTTATGNHEDLFAVNLFPASPNAAFEERAGPSPAGSGSATRGASSSAGAHGSSPAGRVPVDLSTLVAGVALALLCGEWWVASHDR
jgi:hypothetical protein